MQKLWRISMMAMGVLLIIGMGNVRPAAAEQALRFSCSAQLYDILESPVMEAFTQATGVTVDLTISSSEAALYRLYNSVSDVAGTAERVYFPHGDYGYRETQVCDAPIIVITHPENPVAGLSTDQLRDIFSGKITNWQSLGGPDSDIVVVVPGKGTAAYRNFSQLALKRFDIQYAIMTSRSTMVVNVVANTPGSVSFITKGSNQRDASIKIVKVDGLSYQDPNYPYFQSFSLVTRGQPAGVIKDFTNFIASDQTAEMLRANGIFPRQSKR